MAHSYCPITGKQGFDNRREAIIVAERFKHKGRGEPSVYWCDICHSWHLTHYSYARSKRFRQKLQTLTQNLKSKHLNPMTIVIDNSYVQNGTAVCIKDLDDGGQQLQLLLYGKDKESFDARFDYNQALELIEAIKIQVGKMKT